MLSIALLSLVISSEAQSAALPQACPGATLVTLGAELTAPSADMTSVVLANPAGAAEVTPTSVSGGKVSLNATALAEWRDKGAKTPGVVLLWTKADKSQCTQAVSIAASANPSPAPAANAGTAGGTSGGLTVGGTVQKATEDCPAEASAWAQQINAANGRGRRATVLVFKDGALCARSDLRRPASHGDPIYVGILTDNLQAWANLTITFSPCDIEPADMQLKPGDTFPSLSAREASTWYLLKGTPTACWNDSVKIEAKSANAQAGFVLQQYPRYRATVQLGTIFTEQHSSTYGLQTVDGSKRIIDKGPSNNGPEYTASVVFYSVLRYLPPLFGGAPYRGREIRNEQGLVDRIGFMAGVGLKNPRERFVYGATFEVISGVSIFGGWDRSVVNVLPAVLDVTKPFTGEEKDLQTVKEWRTKRVVGLTFDLA